ncbi:enoyl-CoA hydratase/isomerase family protein [Aestuariicella hydrocarbonica]|uniref:Enoyl-CoA hydratase/isomerase family protein n=1 Tax=Pseudomaricurvus hydrocarbonicus TaxID=1470433 RepID=A0A9E5MN06_9GAMM|nr:enoyl-CoA hydratase-related protein [Aestuariicella hydrocarbonica]NHO67222.1 enoyl-CoA hydratase/isomerase family protein [Aestuariicella hydrocarbonica]
MSGAIKTHIENHIAWLTIDHEAKRNALTQVMWRSLDEALKHLQQLPEVRVLVVRGAGDQAFSAGADIKEFTEMVSAPDKLASNNRLIQQAQQSLQTFTKPTIAMIHGACVGGGCGLALACDFRLAASSARFAITPAKLGLLYSKADTRRLYNLVGPAACRELLFTGTSIDADKALRVGLVNEVHEQNTLLDRVTRFAGELATASQYSLRGIKQLLASLEGHGNLDDDQLQGLFDDAFNGEDCREGCQAFLQKRPPQFTYS